MSPLHIDFVLGAAASPFAAGFIEKVGVNDNFFGPIRAQTRFFAL
jgi:hypothetical protein